MALAEVITLKIDSVANSGDGVGRFQDKVVFVPFTAPGDTVKVKILRDKKSFFLAKLVETVEASPKRQNPPCEYFRNCGGCSWQHMDYPAQVEFKTENLKQVLQRVGGQTSLNMLPSVISPKEFHYRNRIQLGVDPKGFYYQKRGSKDKVHIEQCLIADDKINQAWKTLYASAMQKQLGPKVELALEDNELQVVPVRSDHSTELGFRQVNNQVRDLLVDKILKACQLPGIERVYDLYCGRGYWTKKIAEAHPSLEVIGIDSLAANIKFANNSQNSLPENLSFIHSKVEEQLEALNLLESLCIVDPPRAGLDKDLTQTLIDNPSRHLIYISCHPATLARDLKLLTAKSYQLVEAQGFDMFPQTSHLECWTLLQSTSQ